MMSVDSLLLEGPEEELNKLYALLWQMMSVGPGFVSSSISFKNRRFSFCRRILLIQSMWYDVLVKVVVFSFSVNTTLLRMPSKKNLFVGLWWKFHADPGMTGVGGWTIVEIEEKEKNDD